MTSVKTSKTYSIRDPKWLENWGKKAERRAKIAKIAKKSSFLEGWIFEWFSRQKKMKKGSVGEAGGIAAWNQLTRRGRRGVKGELSILDTWILSSYLSTRLEAKGLGG